MLRKTRYILDFEEINRESLILVGGKNASLGEMLKAGIPLPPGFAVTTDSYLKFIKEAQVKDDISKILAAVDATDVASLNNAGGKIRSLIEEASMPPGIEDAIREAYASLCEKCGIKDLPVAVRSSATAEDLPTASFAGQHDTYLWVQGSDEVVGKVQKCWASLFTPRAIGYRIKMNFPHEKVLLSVGVQQMVDAKAAGVMFTINPYNGDPSKIVTEGNWGLGETVVSGLGTTDRFVVDKVIFRVDEEVISHKTVECVYDQKTKEITHREVSPDRCDRSCLERSEVMELARVAKLIEQHYNFPQDIEWAVAKDFPFPENIFIVQSRPETVWSTKRTKPISTKSSYIEYLSDRLIEGW